MKPVQFQVAALALLAAASSLHAADRVGPGVPPFWVRPGYRVTIAAENVGLDVRFMELDDRGTLYVSDPREKKIVALHDADGDGVYETKADFITGKDAVHGMQFVAGPDGGWLWFGMNGAIAKAKVNADGSAGEVVTVVEGLPAGGGHWWRTICVVSDGFFTSIGDSGNLTPEEYDGSDRQKIWKFSLDGKTKTLWSTGIRNTEKLRVRPGTDELWGCDHGSDNFGQPYGEAKAVQDDAKLGKQAITDKMPPEEFNHYVQGAFYGHPFIVGDRVPRLEYKDRPDIAKLAAMTTVPEYKGGAHWANNGWTFVTKDYFPDAKGDAFIAYHGSWNAQQKAGYQIHRVMFDKETGHPYGGYPIVKTLAEDGNTVLARPVDVLEMPDGTLLFSSDNADNKFEPDPTKRKRIYRISKE